MSRAAHRYFVVITPREIYGLFATDLSARQWAERQKFNDWGIRRLSWVNKSMEAQDDGEVRSA